MRKRSTSDYYVIEKLRVKLTVMCLLQKREIYKCKLMNLIPTSNQLSKREKTIWTTQLEGIIKIKSFKNKNQIFHYTRCNTPKRVTSLRGPSPRHCARVTQFISASLRPGNTVSFEEMLQRWRAVKHCVRFGRPEICNSDLPLRRRMRYRSTNWPVHYYIRTY